jgi:hypothetical protein
MNTKVTKAEKMKRAGTGKTFSPRMLRFQGHQCNAEIVVFRNSG